jgi:ribosome maturation factor RimP
MLDPVTDRYMLQISSPGFDRPLRTLEHFERFAGSRVVVTVLGEGEPPAKRKVRGLLLGVRDGCVIVRTEEQELGIEFGRIDRAKVDPVWDD